MKILKLSFVLLSMSLICFTSYAISCTNDQLIYTIGLGTNNCIAYDPINKIIASAGAAGKIFIWDIESGLIEDTLIGHNHEISSIDFSQDGNYLASSAIMDSVVIWDMVTRTIYKKFKDIPNSNPNVRFSLDGKYLFVQGRNIWDINEDTIKTKLQIGYPVESICVSYSKDGTKVVTGHKNRKINIWDANSGMLLRTFSGHRGAVLSVDFNSDGTRLASAGQDSSIMIWNTITGAFLEEIKIHTGVINSIKYSPDGNFIASSSEDSTIKIWDIASKKLLKDFSGNGQGKLNIIFNEDGTKLIGERNDAFISIWNIGLGVTELELKGHTYPIDLVRISPDNRDIAILSNNNITLYDLQNGKEIRKLNSSSKKITTFDFGNAGNYIAVGNSDNYIEFWDIGTGYMISKLSTKRTYVTYLNFHSDSILSVGYKDGYIELYNFNKREFKYIDSLNSSISCIQFSPNGLSMVYSSDLLSSCLWDIETASKICSFQLNGRNFKFNNDGNTIFVGDKDCFFSLWNPFTGKRLKSSNKIVASSFDYSEQSDVAVSSSDQSIGDITIFYPNKNLDKSVFSIKGHLASIYSISLNKKGNLFATGSIDGTVKLWSVPDPTIIFENSRNMINDYHISTYPNPAENYINITIPAGTFRSIEVFDILGNAAPIDYELMPSAVEDLIRLDISRLPIGAWYYQVNQSGSPSFGNFQKTK